MDSSTVYPCSVYGAEEHPKYPTEVWQAGESSTYIECLYGSPETSNPPAQHEEDVTAVEYTEKPQEELAEGNTTLPQVNTDSTPIGSESETSPGPHEDRAVSDKHLRAPAFSVTQSVVRPKSTRFSLATKSAFGLHLGPGAVTMAGFGERSMAGKSRVNLKQTRLNTTNRLGRLGKSMNAVRREVVEETLEEKCWERSPLFRKLAGNFRSLYQIAKTAGTPHLLCLPPDNWRKEENISYQDVQAHLLMPEGSGIWGSLQYHSLRNDGLSVDINEVSEDHIELRVKKRPPPLYESCAPVTSEHIIKVSSWEALEDTSVIVLWLDSPLLKEKAVRRKRTGFDLGASCNGMSLNLHNLGASMLDMTTRSNLGASGTPDHPGTTTEYQKYLSQFVKQYPEVNTIINMMDEEILITNTHYFFPPEDLSHLTPAKTCYLCESFTSDVFKAIGLEPESPLEEVNTSNVEITIGARESDAEEEKKEQIEQSVHTYLIGGIHHKLFGRWAQIYREQEEDFKLLSKELVDLSWVEWQIPVGFRGDQERAVEMLRDLQTLSTPLEMGKSLAIVTVAILEDSPSNEVAGMDIAKEASADLLLPLLMRTIAIAVAGIPDIVPFITALAYVRDFGCPSMGFSNIAYACASFEAAVEFISSGACLDFVTSEEIDIN